ncbi:MAG: 50S ribosomal protein L23 [Chloroflexota bacterium]|nr:50S ribosomal protein L23 [Chloroflexota bacterium]NOG62790.1 50S ribosomal protein L23 [Chloroflexota bacterium]GIK63002.1 MAG: 50S ribosomal protein L23 [Chloroflexota bacterium]
MTKALDKYDVILRPIVSEKSNIVMDELNQYTFEVALNANKIQIKEAVEIIFDVDVLRINTMIIPLKRGRRGRKLYTRKQAWKKAIVQIAPGQSINLFGL